jgi:tetratricopeptide (TPR) repeat protein
VHGAARIDLDVLRPDEAVGLLGRLIGVRAAAEPEALAALAGQCARLPLALRVAAELASRESDTSLRDLVADLLDQRRRLARFRDDDSHADVAAVFSWSLRRLPAAVTEVFRMLGLHPGVDFGSDAVAALSGIPIERAEDAVDRLRRAHLVTSAGPQRYGMHDLLRAYASQLAAQEDHGTREAALRRLLDHYVATASKAAAVLHPAEAHRGPSVPADPVGRSGDFGADTARAWLDRERANLVAVAATGRLHRWPAYPVALSAMLFRYLDAGHADDAEAIHGHALEAARAAGDPAGQGHGCLGLGVVRLLMSDYSAARTLFLEAQHQFAEAGDIRGCARALGNLAGAEEQLGRYAEAADDIHAALRLYVQAGDTLGQIRAESHLGIIERQLGRYDDAARHLRGALTAARGIGDRDAEASAIDNLADVEVDLGRYEEAAELYRTALAMRLEAGDRSAEMWTRTSLGVALTMMGRPQEALRHHEAALETLHDIGQHDAEAWVLNGLGEAAHALAEHRAAVTHHADALAVATVTQAAFQQARAHSGLGRAYRALGDLPAARTHLGLAMTIHRGLGTPDADRAEAELASLDAVA